MAQKPSKFRLNSDCNATLEITWKIKRVQEIMQSDAIALSSLPILNELQVALQLSERALRFLILSVRRIRKDESRVSK